MLHTRRKSPFLVWKLERQCDLILELVTRGALSQQAPPPMHCFVQAHWNIQPVPGITIVAHPSGLNSSNGSTNSTQPCQRGVSILHRYCPVALQHLQPYGSSSSLAELHIHTKWKIQGGRDFRSGLSCGQPSSRVQDQPRGSD